MESVAGAKRKASPEGSLVGGPSHKVQRHGSSIPSAPDQGTLIKRESAGASSGGHRSRPGQPGSDSQSNATSESDSSQATGSSADHDLSTGANVIADLKHILAHQVSSYSVQDKLRSIAEAAFKLSTPEQQEVRQRLTTMPEPARKLFLQAAQDCVASHDSLSTSKDLDRRILLMFSTVLDQAGRAGIIMNVIMGISRMPADVRGSQLKAMIRGMGNQDVSNVALVSQLKYLAPADRYDCFLTMLKRITADSAPQFLTALFHALVFIPEREASYYFGETLRVVPNQTRKAVIDAVQGNVYGLNKLKINDFVQGISPDGSMSEPSASDPSAEAFVPAASSEGPRPGFGEITRSMENTMIPKSGLLNSVADWSKSVLAMPSDELIQPHTFAFVKNLDPATQSDLVAREMDKILTRERPAQWDTDDRPAALPSGASDSRTDADAARLGHEVVRLSPALQQAFFAALFRNKEMVANGFRTNLKGLDMMPGIMSAFPTGLALKHVMDQAAGLNDLDERAQANVAISICKTIDHLEAVFTTGDIHSRGFKASDNEAVKARLVAARNDMAAKVGSLSNVAGRWHLFAHFAETMKECVQRDSAVASNLMDILDVQATRLQEFQRPIASELLQYERTALQTGKRPKKPTKKAAAAALAAAAAAAASGPSAA